MVEFARTNQFRFYLTLLLRVVVWRQLIRAGPLTKRRNRLDNGSSSTASSSASSSSCKGKNYKTIADKKLKEISRDTYFIRNKIRNMKNGSRNVRTATKFRNYHTIGSDFYANPRLDRIFNEADGDEVLIDSIHFRYPNTYKYGVPIRTGRQMKRC